MYISLLILHENHDSQLSTHILRQIFLIWYSLIPKSPIENPSTNIYNPCQGVSQRMACIIMSKPRVM